MASTLHISDGTTTVNFLTDSAYRVLKWSPAVARRATGGLGGRGPYEDVDEEMTLFIGGASALDKLAKLRRVMATAEKWRRGETSAYARITYQATAGSPLLVALITGDMVEIELPGNFTLSPAIQAIDPVILRFRRRGLWLHIDGDTATSSAVEHPAIATISGLTAADADSPVDIALNDLTDFNSTLWFPVYPWYLLRTISSNSMVVLAAEGAGASGPWSLVNDSTNDAHATNVLRYTPAGTGKVFSGNITPFNLSDSFERWGVFINYRNNSATTSFNVSVNLCGSETPALHVPAGVGTPRWSFLGIVSVPRGVPESATVLCQASAASGTIDFDTIAIIALDDDTVGQVVEVTGGPGMKLLTGGDYHFKHRLATHPLPLAYRDNTYSTLSYTGNPTFILPAGETTMRVMFLATSGAKWRACTGGGSPYSTTFTVVQSIGYLTAE